MARGLAQWDAMASDLERRWPDALKKVQQFLDAAPWGGGSEGNAFHDAFLEGNGFQLTLERGSRLVREIAEAGKTVRANVENSLTTDEALANGIENTFAET